MGEQYLFGEWRSGGPPLSAADAARLCGEAERLRRPVADYPLDKALRLLGRTGARWRDADYGPRKKMQAELPAVTGFSPEMVRLGLDEVCRVFDPELLERKRSAELPEAAGLAWEPAGVALHVLAGNVFIGAAGSLAAGVLTRNVNILKMPSSENIFLPELVRSLCECDEEGFLSRSIAVVEYGSSQADVIAEFKRRADLVVVWGGEGAVRSYRDGLPARTRLIVFGPKISMAVVTRKGLEAASPEATALKLAREMSIWDQNACTAPQVCYVEGAASARALAEALPRALDAAALELPPGDLDDASAAEIRKLRGIFEVAEARGEGLLRESPKGLDWSVFLDHDQTLEPSPLHRTLRVIPYEKIDEPLAAAGAMRGYLQTVGLACTPEEGAQLGPLFCAAGAVRVLELGRMSGGEIDDPHDGAYDLPQFMNRVIIRAGGNSRAPGRYRALIDSRLRRLLDAARRSPFYARRLEGLKIETVEDLPAIPRLTRAEMDSNMPPKGEGLCTGAWTGGYVSRSGGSTGEPKFSVYDRFDWERMIAHAVGVLRAAGISETDRLGNLMVAGDLYGSFVSFDHINYRLGAASFAFANTAPPEAFVDACRKFKINAVEGITPFMLPFLRKAKELDPSLTLEKVVYAGGSLTDSERVWLEKELKARRIASIIGANDGGQIGYQCRELGGNMHHATDDFNYLEVTDAQGRPVPEGTEGLLLITSLEKYAYPLIRYAIGDKGRFVPGRCACGRPDRLFEFLGRADEILRVGLLSAEYSDFSRALAHLPVSALQLAARRVEGGECLIVRVETAEPSGELEESVRRALLASLPKVGASLKNGSLFRLSVEFSAPGGLARNPRSGKVRCTVDERS
ncbi:MAG: acyl-CoA reductase [Elusimicrobiales bacterium]|jgi:phenylacetate-coenzyme A ligase PaaK-like adenylate-forming protein